MRPIDRFNLIDSIGRHLQEQMTTVDINTYLGGFGVPNPGTQMAGSKWVYVKELLAAQPDDVVVRVATDLALTVPGNHHSAATALHISITELGLSHCKEDFERALRDIARDPAAAIGHACTTLESICKAILDEYREEYPRDQSLQPLLKAATGILRLSPEQHADEDIKRLLGGLANAGIGLAVLRTKFSSFHGKGARQVRLGARHARLAVNALSAVGLFLVETAVDRRAATPTVD